MSSQKSPRPEPLLKPDDFVITPSGSVAAVIGIYPEVDEVLVQWSSGDRARFKLGLVRLVPPKEA